MVDGRIAKTFENGVYVLDHFFRRALDCVYYLVENRISEEPSREFILHCFPNGGYAKLQPDRCKACMPSVEDPDLPRAVLIEVISVHDIQAGILAGQQLLNMRRPFNCEKVVWLCCHHQLVRSEERRVGK